MNTVAQTLKRWMKATTMSAGEDNLTGIPAGKRQGRMTACSGI